MANGFDVTGTRRFGVGRIAPEVSNDIQWPYTVVGVGFAVVGLALIVIGYTRTRAVERALDRGDFAPLGVRLPLALLVAGVVLGVATALVVLVAR